MFKKFARLFATWLAKLKHWHAVWYDSTVIDTLVRDEKLARRHGGTLARKLRWHASTLTRKPRWHASTLARRLR